MSFRKVLFWSHLVAGLVSGISVGIMCFTGTALAFEKQLIAWSQRDVRQVAPPAEGAPRLTLDQLRARLREAQPEAGTANVVIQNDPRAAVSFGAGGRGGTGGFYVNPYTGEVKQPRATATASFMQTMVTWHRYLGFTGEVSRPRGKWINGVCNIAFAVLAITGLYLWMPRTWSLRGVKAVAILNWRLAGKARDFNWHNSIGLWSAPILVVLTLTAVPISFQWGGRLINTLTGTPQAAPGAAPATAVPAPPPVVVPTPPEGARPLSQDALIAIVQKEIPSWETITVGAAGGRGGAAGGRGGAGGGRAGGAGRAGAAGPGAEGAPAPAAAAAATTTPAPATPAAAAPATAPAATFTVRASDTYPRTSNITLALNPYTGEVLRRSGYADLAPAAQVRAWTRFLHTGEALGFWGQLVAGLACLGGCFLVYTGFALSWRRFFGKKPATPAGTATAQSADATVSSASS
jgi:uncharacterized iron-regulated membrane protein